MESGLDLSREAGAKCHGYESVRTPLSDCHDKTELNDQQKVRMKSNVGDNLPVCPSCRFTYIAITLMPVIESKKKFSGQSSVNS